MNIHTSLKGQPYKHFLIIGKTGTGKSSLCNCLAGHDYNENIFEVSSESQSCTQRIKFGTAFFGGNKERRVALIDTIGFDDPNDDTDARIIAELVDKLKNSCDSVHLFGIAVNGQSPRLDGSLVAMIKIFEEMFGEQFWKQCVLIFTRMPMDEKSQRRRMKTQGKSDEQWALDYIKGVEKSFPKAKAKLRGASNLSSWMPGTTRMTKPRKVHFTNPWRNSTNS